MGEVYVFWRSVHYVTVSAINFSLRAWDSSSYSNSTVWSYPGSQCRLCKCYKTVSITFSADRTAGYLTPSEQVCRIKFAVLTVPWSLYQWLRLLAKVVSFNIQVHVLVYLSSSYKSFTIYSHVCRSANRIVLGEFMFINTIYLIFCDSLNLLEEPIEQKNKPQDTFVFALTHMCICF